MCYGQTGAGKTYTMTGATSDYRRRGIIPRAIQQVSNWISVGREVGGTPRDTLVSALADIQVFQHSEYVLSGFFSFILPKG